MHTPCCSFTLPDPPPAALHGPQVVFKGIRFMNGNSKNGFGGAIRTAGSLELEFIDCEFGGSISE